MYSSKWPRLLLVTGCILVCVSSSSWALYTGSLTSGTPNSSFGKIDGSTGNPWTTNALALPVTFTWTVWDQGQSQSQWTYNYTLFVYDSTAIDHLILEVSEGSNGKDFVLDYPSCAPELICQTGDPQTYAQEQQNPDMPGSIFGLNFSPGATSYAMSITFTSPRPPVWGDFYARVGNYGIWNAGFTDPDPQAVIPPYGWINSYNKILRPDTGSPPPVPSPAAIALAGLGAMMVAWLRMRRAFSV